MSFLLKTWLQKQAAIISLLHYQDIHVGVEVTSYHALMGKLLDQNLFLKLF